MSESMRSGGDALFSKFKSTLDGLGIHMHGEWSRSQGFEGVVRAGRTPLFRVDFSVFDDSAKINVLPMDPSSSHLVGHWPRLDPREPDALEDVEAFFRAVLVAEKRLARREFPTDASLSKWLSAAAAPSVRLSCRNGIALRAAAAKLIPFRDREAVLVLARSAARLALPSLHDGREMDPEHGFAVRSAVHVTRGRLQRFFLCLRTECHVGFLLTGGRRAEVQAVKPGDGDEDEAHPSFCP
jgi:hypothetical protein